MCGGSSYGRQGADGRAGLSPRVRGIRVLTLHENHNIGSIPACAGDPPKRLPLVVRIEVYPRVCGGSPVAA